MKTYLLLPAAVLLISCNSSPSGKPLDGKDDSPADKKLAPTAQADSKPSPANGAARPTTAPTGSSGTMAASSSAKPDADAWRTPGVAPPSIAPGPARLVRALPKQEPIFVKPDVVGWARDSSDFGVCFTDEGVGAQHCTFVSKDGQVVRLSDHQRDVPDPSGAAAIARAKTKGYAIDTKVAHWSLGDSMALTWETFSVSTVQEFAGSVEVRAKIAGEHAPALVERIPAKKGFSFIQPIAYALSPDAKAVGVATYSSRGEFSHEFDVRVWTVEEFGARAMNTAGMAHYKKRDFAQAAELFHRAAHLNPKAEKPMYNLACVLSLLGESGAEQALTLAIERGGEAVKAKARKDADFESVRAADWFVKLVS